VSTLKSDRLDRSPLEKEALSSGDDVLVSGSSLSELYPGVLSTAKAQLVSMRSPAMESSVRSTDPRSNVRRRSRWSRRPRRRSISQLLTITWHPCIMVVDIFMAVVYADVLEDADMSFGVLVRFSES
jgi:hypothetical protein